MENTTVDVWKPFRIAALVLGAALVLVGFWPMLQVSVGNHIPEIVYSVTGQFAMVSLFVVVGVMQLGLVPAMNRWRIAVYLAGTACFLINLLGDENSGNVMLEAALVTQMAWSIRTNWKHNPPVSKDVQSWVQGLALLGACYAVGSISAGMWPVDSHTELVGWWWKWASIAGGTLLYAKVNMLETGILKGTSILYFVLYFIASGLLVSSYLGEYNEAGLTLNLSMMAISMTSLIKVLVQKLRS